jgi:hypothetical protein
MDVTEGQLELNVVDVLSLKYAIPLFHTVPSCLMHITIAVAACIAAPLFTLTRW